MFIPVEDLAAVKKLEEAGFCRTLWSYGTVDLKILGTDPITLKIHRREIREYGRLDQYSVRFHFPSSFNIREVVLLQSPYVHLSPSSAAQISTAPFLPTQRFFIDGNLCYPTRSYYWRALFA
jgi:hypothetical protein